MLLIYSFLDIDECLKPFDHCDRHANCTNAVGSFVCACKGGYSGDGIVNCQGKSKEISLAMASSSYCLC